MDEPDPPVEQDAAEHEAAPHLTVAGETERWRSEAKALLHAARVLAPLTKEKSWADRKKWLQLVQKLRGRLQPGRGAVFLDEVVASAQRRAEQRRRELSRRLQEACQAQGLELRIVRREEPVLLRIPPFAVEIDRDRDRSTLLFARLPIDSCAAEASAIVDLVIRRRDAWSRDFDARSFFEACHRAWTQARARDRSQNERVEIAALMPFLAFELQPARFYKEPTAKNFVAYPRSRFAFDLMQLRRAGMLSLDDWRLNLGVASGNTATDKRRALFVEDEQGDGEYKLTVYFTKT